MCSFSLSFSSSRADCCCSSYCWRARNCSTSLSLLANALLQSPSCSSSCSDSKLTLLSLSMVSLWFLTASSYLASVYERVIYKWWFCSYSWSYLRLKTYSTSPADSCSVSACNSSILVCSIEFYFFMFSSASASSSNAATNLLRPVFSVLKV